ncbi:MAG: DUF2238 domain-containing protein [Candidatus Pacearchaeota archaeon]
MIKPIVREMIGRYLAYFMQVLILGFIIWGVYLGKYLPAFEGVICLIFTFIPLMLKRKKGIHLPWTLNFLIVFSLYFHTSGRIFGLYPMFYPFYDKFGHFMGSVTVALLGFTAFVIMDRYTELKLKKHHIVFFIVIFTLAIGAFWEIIEFTADKLFHATNQYSLDDTMYDLVFDLFGGLFIAFLTKVNFDTMRNKIVVKKR